MSWSACEDFETDLKLKLVVTFERTIQGFIDD